MHIKKLHIHPTFFALALASLLLGFWEILLLSYAAIIIHELAHVAVAGLFGIPVKRFDILPFGVMIKIETDVITPRHELAIALAGPAANLAMMLIAIPLNLPFLVHINASLALINLIPALPLDGGRALKSLLMMRWHTIKAYNFTMTITKISITLLTIASLALLFITQINFSLLIIATFLIVNFSFECKNYSLLRMRNTIYSSEKLDNGMMSCSHIAAKSTLPASKVLKNFGWNHYYIIDVIAEDSSISGTITETALINALAAKGIRTPLSDIIKAIN